ncbi:hypothetical protein AAVH_21651 [Aphelenchoides avenae]|nr:hypothetical protein AAVH_21651 [Aphelenchus avenae]
MRFTDNFRRHVIAEIRDRARVVWDPTEPGFHSCGARSDAFHGVAYRLHDASIQQDVRRMWHRWACAVYDYKLKRLSRKPNFTSSHPSTSTSSQPLPIFTSYPRECIKSGLTYFPSCRGVSPKKSLH